MQITDIIGFKRAKGADAREIISVTPSTPIVEAIDILATRKIGLVVVCDESGSLVGVLSERDIVRLIATKGDEGLNQDVGSIMTSNVLTCTPDQHPHEAIAIMAEKGIRHIPVVSKGRLQAVISITDVLRYLTKNAKPEEQAMLWAKIAWA
jgi:CBS domain-containing protein